MTTSFINLESYRKKHCIIQKLHIDFLILKKSFLLLMRDNMILLHLLIN